MDRWNRLRRALEVPDPTPVDRTQGRVGAALALLSDPGDGDLEFVLTRRKDDLSHHPGQISFPGGRVDPGESVPEAAVREAAEEVAVDPGSVEVIGALPAGYIPPSRYWLQVVVGRWHAPHRLVPAEAEVAEVLAARLSTLLDADAWRVVRLSARGDSWAWQLDDRHLLWGATAMAIAELLDILEPGWHRGTDPAAMPPEREARPWIPGGYHVPRPGPARLAGVAEAPVAASRSGVGEAPVAASRSGVGEAPVAASRSGVGEAPVAASPAGEAPVAASRSGEAPISAASDLRADLSPRAVRTAGDAVADAVARLDRGRRVLVLAGAGGDGAVGLAAARSLTGRGLDVDVVLSAAPEELREPARREIDGLDASTLDGRLPPADVLVDALVGRGLRGPLGRSALEVVHAMRYHLAPVISVDLPTGIDPRDGLVGDCVAADVTVAIGQLSEGLLGRGLGPFVGDLYLAPLDGPLLRLVPGPDGSRWRE